MNEELWNLKTRLDDAEHFIGDPTNPNSRKLFFAQTYLDLISDDPAIAMLGICNSQAYSRVLQTAWDSLPQEYKVDVAQLSKISVSVAIGLLSNIQHKAHQDAICAAMKTKEDQWRVALTKTIDAGDVNLADVPISWLEETLMSMNVAA